MGYNRALTGSTFSRSELKTGKRPPPKSIKTFPPGTPLFKEDEVGRELFIISEGEVKITKGVRDDEVTLATLGSGAILGEMSLLDKQPRSATATTTQTTKAVIINEATFNAVANLLPIWLTSIIRIITSRLRDTNKFIGTSILKNREKGICHLLYMAAQESEKSSKENSCRLDYFDFVSEVQFVTKLKKGDVDLGLGKLESKSLISLESSLGTKTLIVHNIAALKYFVDFQFLKEQNKKPPLLLIEEKVRTTLLHIQKLAGLENLAKKGPYVMIPKTTVEAALREKQPDLKPGALKELIATGLLKYVGPSGNSGTAYFAVNPSQVADSFKSLEWMQKFSGIE